MGRLGRVKDGTSEGLMDFMALDGCRVTLRYVPGLRRLSPQCAKSPQEAQPNVIVPGFAARWR